MLKFRQFIDEMSQQMAGVEFDFSTHFFDRLKERGQITQVQFDIMMRNVRKKLADLPPTGQFLFYSQKLRQGIVTAWDAFSKKLSLITFLPRMKHTPKTGTTEIVVESITYTIIEID